MIHKATKQLLIVLLLTIPFLSFGQTTVDNQLTTWISYGGNHKVSENYSIHTLAQAMRHDFVKDWQQSLIRLGVNRKINDNVTFGIGGDWLESWPYGKQPIAERFTEFRSYERVQVSQKINKLGLIHRLYLEQRYFERHTDHRLRYRYTLTHPLNNNVKIVGFNELFLNLGESSFGKNFNQNWAYLGVNFKVGKGSIDFGYMNQFLVKGDRVRAESNHTINVGYNYSFDFTNK